VLGAITGDIIGSVYEFDSNKPEHDFPLFVNESEFTDDSVLTVALADSILNNISYKEKLIEYYRFYPYCSFGSGFQLWAGGTERKPYNSWGNGSAMRVSAVGWAYNDLETVLLKAKESAEVTHNHPEGIKGAQATASAIFLSRTGQSKEIIKDYITKNFGYNLGLDIEDLRKNYRFNESCQETVPQAIFTFLISDNFEDSIRKAIYIGGDSDTLACINGSIAEAFYGGVPEEIKSEVYKRMDSRITIITNDFREKYIIKKT
jgi:ADP-ribosylglycohydrolase